MISFSDSPRRRRAPVRNLHSRRKATRLGRLVRPGIALLLVVLTMSAVPSWLVAQTSGGEASAAAGEQQAGAAPRSAIPTNLTQAAVAMGMFFLVAFIICSVVAVWFVIERLVVL